MKIVAARNMPFAEDAFATLGEVVLLEGRSIGPADVRDADVLVTRSTTPITPELLEGSRVRFYGTATIGTDHVDIPYLASRGIPWCAAAGCNANSVSEYVTAALLCVGQRHGTRLAGKTLGIIGVGNVGTRVMEKARALGLRVLCHDPPRERRGDPGPWTARDALLAASDIVTLHVPLTDDGPDATRGLADEGFFAALKPGAWFFNTARGPVMDSRALETALVHGGVGHAVIDCWEGEPGFEPGLLSRADLGTPHIAGYSFDGKVNGTMMVYREACRVLGRAPTWRPEGRMPSPAMPDITLAAAGRDPETVLWELVRRVYDIEADDAALRHAMDRDAAGRAQAFDRHRGDYPLRREFSATRVSFAGADAGLARTVAGLGFAPGA